jgi:hypothetical protein
MLAACLQPRPASGADAAAPAYPQAVLSNRAIRVTLYLPDAQKGYYRGPRFDWSGMVSRVECNGHAFFTPFRTPHKPENSDAVIGTADEFGMTSPLGFEESEEGETFLKIGVGALLKPAANGGKPTDYEFGKAYRISKPDEWRVTRGNASVEFEQNVRGGRGWAYHYVKRIALVDGAAAFTMEHILNNTGTRAISTDVYCHNFVSIDDDPIGPDYRVSFAFAPKPKDAGRLVGIAHIADQSILFDALIRRGKGVWAELEGPTGLACQNLARVENIRTGAAVTITGDAPPKKINIYAEHHVVCPEVFVAVEIAPGEEKRWYSRYEFSSSPAHAQQKGK